MLAYLRMLAVILRLPTDRRPQDSCSWDDAGHMAGALTSAMLHPSVQAWVRSAGGASAAAAIAAAAQLMQQLPVDGPEFEHNGPPVLALAGNLCMPACQDPAVLARKSTEDRRRAASQLLPAVSLLPQLVQRPSSCPLADLPANELVSLSVPCVSVKFQVDLLGDYAAGSFGANMNTPAPFGSTADCAPWASTAAALLRCMPLLHELHTAMQHYEHLAASAAQVANMAQVVHQLLPRAAHLLFLATQCSETVAGEAAARTALQALWELHSTMCRCVHFAAAARHQQLAEQPVLQHAPTVLSMTLCAAALILHTTFGLGDSQANGASDAAALARR